MEYIFDKKPRFLIKELSPYIFVLLFYPEITRKLNNIVSTLNQETLKKIFPEKVNLINSINNEVITTLTQITETQLKNMFITVPFISIKDVNNNNIYPLNKSEYQSYLSKIGQPISGKQFMELLKLLSNEQIKSLLSTLLPFQKKNILSLIPEDKLKSIVTEKYGIF